ncbi:TlpA family protein disulfide reductase [Methylotenera mobilis]|uniref:Redoxin domain protein n=1 Tax=Methylotenera mobilis (strain JLW8 / ATCC BAA-1282 / DSM 17540) TaxID=583345 RepID=C6WYU3_METML|nr:TlpA disulfide reductase family protein [Methylotenera mobilis]ACT47068.1 Redoxin domain protein [Methylotenera mobilis JLW8]
MLKKILKSIFFIALASCLALSLAFILRYIAEQNADNQPSGAALYVAKLPDIYGKMQDLGQYRHKVIIVNFWATWCPPCREEMPELIALQQAYQDKNVVVLGIALDEPAQVAQYLKSTSVNYPIVANDVAGSMLGEQLGNDKGVLPYTVIINTDGNIVNAHFGRITQAMIEASIKPLIPASTR